jgi:CRISPR system Cascade subunit CasE
MYHSCLLIDVGRDPDRPRPGRLWLRNRYHVHQRLCMAFPSDPRKTADPEFLQPFKPEDFAREIDGAPQVRVERRPNAGFLFRIDRHPSGAVVIIVQSAVRPDWEYAFHNVKHLLKPEHLLAAEAAVREFDPSFTNGDSLRFRLTANPTRKIDTKTGPDGKKNHGRRVPVRADGLYNWLARKGAANGFSVGEGAVVIQTGYAYAKKPTDREGQKLFAVSYEGRLTVTDAARFREALIQGIGSAKGYGFGLLSAVPAGGN